MCPPITVPIGWLVLTIRSGSMATPASFRYYQTREALLADYRTLCDRIYAVLPRYFETIPDAKLEIVEKNSETAPAAYYMQGTADGARPGRFYVCGNFDIVSAEHPGAAPLPAAY